MSVTETLKDDHELIRVALEDVNASMATTLRHVEILQQRYGDLVEAVNQHARREDCTLCACGEALDDALRSLVEGAHARQRDHLNLSGAEIDHARASLEETASELASLTTCVQQDMQSEERRLFPAVERSATMRVPPAEGASPPRRRRIPWESVLIVLGSVVVITLAWPLQVGREPDRAPRGMAAPAALGATVLLSPEDIAAVRQLKIQYGNAFVPFDGFARDSIGLITGQPPATAEEAIRIALAVMGDPTRWRDHPMIPVQAPELRSRLELSPEDAEVSYLQLAASDVFIAVPWLMQKLRRHALMTPQDHDVLLLYERFLALHTLLDQELSLIPPYRGMRGPWLPILRPTGYPTDSLIQVKRLWSELLAAARLGESLLVVEKSRRLSDLLRAFQSMPHHPVP
jgi:hypothetical protein